jgi:hypothetical protein
MKRKLVLKAIRAHRQVTDNFYVVWVDQQTHRQGDFAGCSGFTASNGITLDSVSGIEADERSNTLYLRGHADEDDHNRVIVSPEFFKELKVAVKEYNETNGGFPVEEGQEETPDNVEVLTIE